jgi:murein tripeptide amidase MpaA
MKHICSYHLTRYPCARRGDATVKASGCARALLCLAVVLCAMSAGAAEPGNYLSERFEPLADVPAARQIWHFRWERYGRSTQGRPIETLQIGKGPFRTLVLGSLHGSETMAVEIVEQLARHLGKTPDHWHEVNVLVVRTPNPDGFAKHNSLNARKVDLNRNFPSTTVGLP